MEELVVFFVSFFFSIIASVFCYGAYIFFQHRKYDHIPGPSRPSFWLGNTAELLKYTQKHGNFHTLLVEYFRRYGHTIKFFIFHYVMVYTVERDAIKRILMSENFTKSREYNHIRTIFGVRIFGSGLVTQFDHHKWLTQRARMNPFFTRSAIKRSSVCIEQNADRLVVKLDALARTNATVSFHQEMRRVTLDIITQILFSEDMDVINNIDSPVFDGFEHLFEAMHQSFYFPHIKFDPRYAQFRQDTRNKVISVRRQLTDMLQRRRCMISLDRAVPDDFLTATARYLDNEPDTPMEEIIDDLFTALIAGHDTVASHLTILLWMLTQHPDIRERVYKEIDDATEQKKNITFEDINGLTYTNAVIKETLRMYPSGPEISRQSNDEFIIDKLTIPACSPLKISLLACSRMEECFNNPDIFNPERFLGDESQSSSLSFSYIPFAHGSRGCLGQHFAKVEAKIILIKLLQKFTFELIPKQSFKLVQLLTLQIQDGLKLKLHRRREPTL